MDDQFCLFHCLIGQILWHSSVLSFLFFVFHSSATTRTLAGMLLGRFLVGTGLGVGPPVASLYVTEVKKISILGVFL